MSLVVTVACPLCKEKVEVWMYGGEWDLKRVLHQGCGEPEVVREKPLFEVIFDPPRRPF